MTSWTSIERSSIRNDQFQLIWHEDNGFINSDSIHDGLNQFQNKTHPN